jgi:O-antigen/teichoic acid export membrane protein
VAAAQLTFHFEAKVRISQLRIIRNIIKSKLNILFQKQSTAKWLRIGKLTTITGLSQVGIQAIGFISGILVIRLLSTEEYALYTLSNTMLGAMAMLSDSGVASSVMAEGGKVWKDKGQLGSAVATGMFLRKRLAIISVILTAPPLFYLLHYHGATWLNSILIFIALMPAFFSALSWKILEIVPKLHQDVVSIQRIQLLNNSGRLGLLGLSIFVFPYTFVAIAATGIAQVFANIQLKKRAKKFISSNPVKSRDIQSRIVGLVKRTMPGTFYYIFAGQLTIWLISIFGNTENVAQIGALGRLAAVLVIADRILRVLFVPYFARIQDRKKLLVQLFFILQVGLLVFTGITSLFVWTFPDFILSIIGPQYAGLRVELLLVTLLSCISLQGVVTHDISASLGIVPSPVWMISYMLFFQIGLVFLFDFSILSQVILYSIIIKVATFIYQAIYFLSRVPKLKAVSV